ncbi:NAD(P)-binding domain-containing protein [Nocardia pseudovaccinii]|uniref:NAD(P)-binding domain-containing protein n=1 Tax=Nocardia pseudovaccinii TaxID=189540 RepID=UPI0007A4B2AB|nr:NAD(P)-binding domain-containing protein [Nocardia pseudovaccinii]
MHLTLGLIGSGMIGTSIARLAISAGLDVVLSNSRGPATLADLVSELGGQARATTAAEAARAADLVVAAIPLMAFRKLPVEWTLRTPGIPVPVPQLTELVETAVRQPAGEAELPSAD